MKASEAKKLEDLFEMREIKGKRVFIVDDHHKAFAAWAVVRREREDAPILISFDHHTDTMPAYRNASAVKHPYDDDARIAYRDELIGKLGWRDDEEVLASVAKLKHDEHVDAAAMCGVLSASFSIQLDSMSDTPTSVEMDAYYDKRQKAGWMRDANIEEPTQPFTYREPPENNVFVVGHECFIGCEGRPHVDECIRVHHSEVLESIYVEDQLARAAAMARSIGIEGGLESAPYILDIDLDVFHTVAAIEPKDAASFYRLIGGALAITIATEAECVEDLWREDEEVKLTASDLLDRMLAHIERALARDGSGDESELRER